MIDEVVRSHSLVLGFLHRLLADVPDDWFARQPPGAVNHPAWVIGHLTSSCQAIGGEIGLPPWLDDDWQTRFGTGSTPTDRRHEYPTKAELLATLDDARQRVAARLRRLGESALGQPLPDERYREIFPTLGHAVLHILAAHSAVHVGQLTVWRRAVGLPPMADPFI